MADDTDPGTDHERTAWIDALAFDDFYGTQGPEKIDQRIQDCRQVGNNDEAARWINVAGKIAELYRRRAAGVE
ncbi:hypothetical protein [Sphingobium sp. CR28]|uniref:hypothetical protein n=1 Tax=Sphingobium sp. CR28 TaxID=3400272 RepID=UPI003FEFEE35